jgi:transcriptional regulator with XRE-family HTH domain
VAIGERLREERKRLKMTQAEFSDVGGIGISTLKLYEGNDRDPGALCLQSLAQHGVDVQYVVTGQRSKVVLAADEQLLLDGFRALDAGTKRRMLAFALTESGPVAIQKKIKEKSAESGNKTVSNKYRGAKIGGVTEGDFTGTANVHVGGKRNK